MTLLLEDIMPNSDFQFKEAGILIGDNGKEIGQFSYNGKLWE